MMSKGRREAGVFVLFPGQPKRGPEGSGDPHEVQTRVLPPDSSVWLGRHHSVAQPSVELARHSTGLTPSLAKLPVATVPGQAPAW